MSVRVKFCGLTRAEDAAVAETLGASYLGVIFAGGPRLQTVESAAQVLSGRDQRGNDALVQPASSHNAEARDTNGRTLALRVGVWGQVGEDLTELIRVVQSVPLDVVQLHGDPTVSDVERVKTALTSAGIAREDREIQVWAVIRVEGDISLTAQQLALFQAADAVVLDAKASTQLGGTGTVFNWRSVAQQIAPSRGHTMLVLAGGLNPENVAQAVRILRPDVVDVSSGVESAPGIKNHQRMQQFVDAVRDRWSPEMAAVR